jgi:hypothetical protein
MEENKNIILLDEILDLRTRKRKELEYYNQQLEELKMRMFFIQKEIDLTSNIIVMIEKEKMVDLKKFINDSNHKNS